MVCDYVLVIHPEARFSYNCVIHGMRYGLVSESFTSCDVGILWLQGRIKLVTAVSMDALHSAAHSLLHLNLVRRKHLISSELDLARCKLILTRVRCCHCILTHPVCTSDYFV